MYRVNDVWEYAYTLGCMCFQQPSPFPPPGFLALGGFVCSLYCSCAGAAPARGRALDCGGLSRQQDKGQDVIFGCILRNDEASHLLRPVTRWICADYPVRGVPMHGLPHPRAQTPADDCATYGPARNNRSTDQGNPDDGPIADAGDGRLRLAELEPHFHCSVLEPVSAARCCTASFVISADPAGVAAVISKCITPLSSLPPKAEPLPISCMRRSTIAGARCWRVLAR